MFEVCVFHRLEGCFSELIKNNRKVPFQEIPGTFRMISVKNGEQLVKVCALENMVPSWAQGVNNGRPVTINDRGVPV